MKCSSSEKLINQTSNSKKGVFLLKAVTKLIKVRVLLLKK